MGCTVGCAAWGAHDALIWGLWAQAKHCQMRGLLSKAAPSSFVWWPEGTRAALILGLLPANTNAGGDGGVLCPAGTAFTCWLSGNTRELLHCEPLCISCRSMPEARSSSTWCVSTLTSWRRITLASPSATPTARR